MNKLNLKSLAEYQDNAIVSKKIIDLDTGKVTFFAFDKDQQLSKHSAPFDAFVQILEGTGKITIDEIDSTLIEGEAIIMPANIPHSVYAVTQFKMLLTMIKK